MPLEIEFEGADADELARDLRNWLQQEALADFTAEFSPGRRVPNTMGWEILPILKLLFNTRAAAGLVGSFTTWIRSRRPRSKVKFKRGKQELTLDLEGQPLDDAMIARIKVLLEAS
jgi:hypothetical protein